MLNRLVDGAFWLGWNALWVLPERAARLLFRLAARMIVLRRTHGFRQLEINLRQLTAQADVHAQAAQSISNYMRYYCDTFLLPRWNEQEVRQRVRPIHAERIAQALSDGGAILTLPHAGNWDLGGAWAAHEFGSLVTVAERLRPEGVFRKFMAARAAHGLTLMPLTGDGGTYEWLRSNVSAGRLVALLGDRDVAGSGLGVPFAGARAVLPIGAALLAIDTGRPLLTVHTYYEGDSLVVAIDEPLDFDRTPCTGKERIRRAREVTELVAQRFEIGLRQHPDSWAMLQQVWPERVTL